MRQRSLHGVSAILALVVAAAPASADVSAQGASSPERIAGLVAHYEVSFAGLGRTQQADVYTWRDSSGYGQDLILEQDGEPALRRGLRLNKLATIEVRAGAYDVSEPFELYDHTIFVVASVPGVDRVLLSSDADPTIGIALRKMGRDHVLRAGTETAYTKLTRRQDGFHVIVLGREAGTLRGFVDGADVSSGQRNDAPLRVGRFFDLVYGERRRKDGKGLEIAEMLIYDRFLPSAERAALTAELVTRFGLDRSRASTSQATTDADAAVPSARLRTDRPIGLNDPAGVVAIPWSVPEALAAPFRHDAAGSASRIGCATDGTPVRVRLTLGLTASQPGVNVRVLLLRNNVEYLPVDAVSGEFGGAGEAGTATVELETTVLLAAGDWIEVVTQGIGAEGDVLLDPARTVLVADVAREQSVQSGQSRGGP